MSRGVPARLLALLPYAVSGWLPALTPARAVLLGWLLESGSPGPPGRGEDRDFGLRHAAPWLLLHGLRPDAPLWAGAGLVLAATLLRRWWGVRGRGRRGLALVALALLPALSGFVLAVAGRTSPAWLQTVDAWAAAGSRTPGPAGTDRPPLPAGRYASLDFELPPTLWPAPLEDSPEHGRAVVALAVLLLWCAAAASLPAGLRRGLLAGGALAAAGLGAVFFSGPKGLLVFHADQDGRRILEAYAAGGDLWDPGRGDLLPPRCRAGGWQVRAAADPALWRVVSPAPWAVVRPDGGWEPPARPAAWLEVQPLRAPRGGGPAAERGGLGVLRLWAAHDQARGQAARWLLAGDGSLYRLPLPE